MRTKKYFLVSLTNDPSSENGALIERDSVLIKINKNTSNQISRKSALSKSYDSIVDAKALGHDRENFLEIENKFWKHLSL